jgi:hypothetical protein
MIGELRSCSREAKKMHKFVKCSKFVNCSKTEKSYDSKIVLKNVQKLKMFRFENVHVKKLFKSRKCSNLKIFKFII